MLKVLLKHIIYDAGISVFFDNLIKSFNINLYGKWASSPDAFKNDHKIGSVLYVDFEFWMIDKHNTDKTNVVVKITNYPTVVVGHLPLGVDNSLLLYVSSDLFYYNEPAIVKYDIITERWNYKGGMFKHDLNNEVMIRLGYDLWNN